MRLTLDYLANHREFIPQLAAWSDAEWRHFIEARGLKFDDVVAGFHRRTNIDALPLGIVAFADDELAGNGALLPADLPVRQELTPWLGGIYVAGGKRGLGIATAIVERLVDEARRLQLPRLYLWTNSAAGLYAKLGWDEVEKLEYCGHAVIVMAREL